jgi:hypothetical protein
MVTVAEALERCTAWEQPRLVEGYPFKVACRLQGPATPEEIAGAGVSVPEPVENLWKTARSAELFVDVEHGQTGLRLLSPADSARRSAQERADRPSDFRDDDVVVGEFLGDQDLLVVDAGGQPLVALPLDERADWDRPAGHLADFLSRFVAADGDKYWER